MRPRKSRSRPTSNVNVKKADRRELKCRFEFYFKVCQCKHCLLQSACDEHAAAMRAELEAEQVEARGAAKAAGKEFILVECHCGRREDDEGCCGCCASQAVAQGSGDGDGEGQP